MAVDLATIRRLEAIADRAWPPAEIVAHDGWQLRATGPGIGRRVNSVAPIEDGTLPLEKKVAAAEAFYRERGLPPTFKLTAAARPARLEAYLEAGGYRIDAPVLIMTRRLVPARGSHIDLESRPGPDWLAANAAVPGHYGAAPAAFQELVARIERPAAYAALAREGQTAAIGMAVADAGWVGLFEIGTVPQHRRRGLATTVVDGLLAWGASREADGAYLQVMESNAPARALYARLGFVEAYRYWYRVAD